MLLLVIDTSSAAVTAAVADVSAEPRVAESPVVEPQVLAERVTVDARAHAELLIPSIDAVLREAGARPSDLGAVVAGVGPGPFTGLRVGLVTAAVLGDALRRPTYAVDSLDAVAHGLDGDGPLLVATDARRREVYWALYRDGRRLTDPAVGRPAAVRAEVGDQAGAMTGAGARLYAETLSYPLGQRDYPAAAALAALGADRVRRRAVSEPLRPRYLRQPDAVAPVGLKPVRT